ncbi:tetratricopeptide repeat-containing sensor histidine kinase [Mucilaginibacter aquatilis]|uniref:histidine kinase n=1 Tax=Mucilaginibacter aquatilis TaxID=1517760 RepID=A0A6I4I4D5_9SPHI|nr:ATP-binding protein [Mucilaginibacter aquatilis]MVN89627.1 two-component sensor histidine kinase [Mucilaginibacter aquatilis]
MKNVLLSCFGLVAVLYACMQNNDNKSYVTPNQVDSARIRSYEFKSAMYQAKRPDSAVHYAAAGLKLARKLNDAKGEALMMNRFARINEQYGNFGLAVKYQQGVIKIYNHLQMHQAATEGNINLAVLQAEEGHVKQARHLLNKVLNDVKEQKDTLGIVKALIALGEVAELANNPKQALSYLEKAEKMHGGDEVTDAYVSLLGKIGRLHSSLNNHGRAMDYYAKGIQKSKKGGHSKGHAKMLNHAGRVLDSLGNKREALQYHQEGLKQSRVFGLPEEEARSLMGIASSLKAEDAEGSVLHLKNALGIAHSIGHKHLAAEIYHSLSDIYRQQSRYADAMSALQEHHRLLDSLMDANRAHKIAVLQSSYELAQSRLQVETLELSNREKTYQRNLLICAATGVLLILVILAWNYRKNKLLNKRLEASNVIKDKLFSIIGHDLRNPIGGLTQLIGVLRDEDLGKQERDEMLAEMQKQGNITLDILNALLKWGETQLKGIDLSPVNFKPTEVIARNFTALQTQAAEKNVALFNEIQPDLLVLGDVNHFDFISRNLISNAIKFSYKESKVEVLATVDQPNNMAVFEVKDYGKGISMQQQQRFFKTGMEIAYGTGGEKGTGLGLMLAKEFVLANKGRMWLQSTEGAGASFFFSFPLGQH